MNKDYLVTKSNKLITCNYDLSLQEQKIILTLASMVQPQDQEFKEYEFKVGEFIKLLGVKDDKKYTEVPKLTKELMKKVFEIKEGKDIIQLSWISSARHRRGEGTVILKFDSNLKPYMLGLKEFYTSYKLENVLSLKSKYSIRLYEILKSNLYKGQIEIELEELKNMLWAREKSYSLYTNFKGKVLHQAKRELKEETDISFEFEEIKTGRKVTSLRFIITENREKRNPKIKITKELPVDPRAADEMAAAAEEQLDNDLNQDILVNQVKLYLDGKLTDKQVATLLKDANDDVTLIHEKIELAKTQNVDDLMGWLRSAIRGDYKPSESQKKQRKIMPGDASKRRYTGEQIREIERKLLGRE